MILLARPNAFFVQPPKNICSPHNFFVVAYFWRDWKMRRRRRNFSSFLSFRLMNLLVVIIWALKALFYVTDILRLSILDCTVNTSKGIHSIYGMLMMMQAKQEKREYWEICMENMHGKETFLALFAYKKDLSIWST